MPRFHYLAVFILVGLVGCAEGIDSIPDEKPSPNTSYGWTSDGSATLSGSDGSSRTLNVASDGSYLLDSSAGGTDTLRLRAQGDSVLISGLTPHSFLPLVFGGRLEQDTDYTTVQRTPTVLLSGPDSMFFASGHDLLVYDIERDVSAVRGSLPAAISFLERVSDHVWYAVAADRHLYLSLDRGFTWLDKGTTPGAVRAIESASVGTLGNLYAAVEGGDIMRFDGAGWSRAYQGRADWTINCLKLDPGPSHTMFAGTDEGDIIAFPLSGNPRVSSMTIAGRPIPVVGIALEYGPKNNRVWAAGKGAVFIGDNFGQTWKPFPSLAITSTSIYSFGDRVWIGAEDGNVYALHDDDNPEVSLGSSSRVAALGSMNGGLTAIAGDDLYVTSKQGKWVLASTSAHIARYNAHPWVMLTKDSLWQAGVVIANGSRHAYMGHVLGHSRELRLHGRQHHDILVVEYYAKTDVGIDTVTVPKYVVYFEERRGPIRIEITQAGKPDVVEDVE
jgi:hypothetical protein